MSNSRVQPKPNALYVVGIDLGGTNVRAAVLDRNEKSLGRHEVPSDAKSGVANTVRRIGEAVRGAVADAKVSLDEGFAELIEWAKTTPDVAVDFFDKALQELQEKGLLVKS